MKKKLFPEEYGLMLRGKSVCIGVQSDTLLKERRGAILQDLKYLLRFGVRTFLAHTFADKTEVEDFFRGSAEVISLHNQDFLTRILEFSPEKGFHKIVLLESRALRSKKDDRLIDLITRSDRSKLDDLLVKNADVERVKRILGAIKNSRELRCVHIIPGKDRDAIRNELFSIEGIGTMIAEKINANFDTCSDDDIHTILNILKPYIKSGAILPRDFDYIQNKIGNFFKVTTDGVLAGCVEKMPLSDSLAELGALISIERFIGRRIGKFLLEGILENLKTENFDQALVVTKNVDLGRSLIRFYGFREIKPTDQNLSSEIIARMQRSTYARFFIKDL